MTVNKKVDYIDLLLLLFLIVLDIKQGNRLWLRKKKLKLSVSQADSTLFCWLLRVAFRVGLTEAIGFGWLFEIYIISAEWE
jgi:uncharacterized membrane protein YbjE (DUF340 family)